MDTLFELIKKGLNKYNRLPSCDDWYLLMSQAFDQGVGGISFDALQKAIKSTLGLVLMKDDEMQTKLFMEWFGLVNIAKKYMSKIEGV